MPKARFYAIIPGSDAETRSIVEQTAWSLDRPATKRSQGQVQILHLDEAIENPSQLPSKGHQLAEELKLSEGPDPEGMVAHLIGSDEIGDASKGLFAMSLAPSMTSGQLATLISSVLGVSGAQDSKTDGKAPEPPAEKSVDPAAKAAAPVEEKADQSAPCCPAATMTAAIPAFVDPSALWKWADKGERGELARKLLPDLYEDRSKFSKKTEWTLAPEMVLLEASPEDRQRHLAEELLKVRGQLTSADVSLREADAELVKKKVELAGKDVELAGKRVELAGKGVSLAGEMLDHMKKWRSIANWGLAFLVATTIFSMAAVGYVLLKLIPDKEVSDVAAPIIIFVLALFAISPAVLLLRERPLEGLDKWSPGGGEESSGAEDDSTSEETGKDTSSGVTSSNGASSKNTSSAG